MRHLRVFVSLAAPALLVLTSSTINAQTSQRDEQEAAERAFQAGADEYNGVTREAGRDLRNTADVAIPAAIWGEAGAASGAWSGGAVGAVVDGLIGATAGAVSGAVDAYKDDVKDKQQDDQQDNENQ